MASHDPSKYRFSTPTYLLLFSTLLTAYYMYVFNPLAEVLGVDFELWQLGYLDVSKESIQNANPRNPYLPEYISAITLGYAEESNFHPDCSWVCSSSLLWSKFLDSHKYYSNRLLTSGWWAYSRKPVRCYFTLSLAYHLCPFFSELCCRLGHVVHLGCHCWPCHPYSLFLFRVLHHCACA